MSQLTNQNSSADSSEMQIKEARGRFFDKLIHSAGLVCVFAGALIALAEILHPAGEDLIAVQSPMWSPAHMTWWLGVVMLQFGLIGLYARHADELGWLGLISFVMTFFGASLTSGILFLQSGAVPLIAPRFPPIASELLYGPVFWVLLNEASFGGGIILFAVATMRAHVYPRWASLLVIYGIVLYLVSWWPSDRVLSHAIALASNLTFGLGIAWMGYALWSEKHPVLRIG
jgi:hypothetical protein